MSPCLFIACLFIIYLFSYLVGPGYHVRRDLGQVIEMYEVLRQTRDTRY